MRPQVAVQPPFLVVNVLDIDNVVGANWVAVCWVVESRGRHLPKSVRIIYRTWSSCLAVERFARPCAPPASCVHILTCLSSRCLYVSVDRRANSCTLRTSALALCCSVAEYCCQIYRQDPVTRLLSTLGSTAPCAWVQPACVPLKFHVIDASQHNPCFTMSDPGNYSTEAHPDCPVYPAVLTTRLHNLHLNFQHGQEWCLST